MGFILTTICALIPTFTTLAQTTEDAKPPAKKLSLSEQILRPLAKVVIIDEAFEDATAANVIVAIDLTHQLMTVTVNNQTALTSPVTTGRRASPTKLETYTIKSRDPAPKSVGYGYFVNKEGSILVKGVYQSLDPPPYGTFFVEARQTHALILDPDAPRILSGHVRGTPCTNGDIIVPENVALKLFKKIPDGAKVKITR